MQIIGRTTPFYKGNSIPKEWSVCKELTPTYEEKILDYLNTLRTDINVKYYLVWDEYEIKS